MNKPLLGPVLGGILGILDAGLLIGWFARRRAGLVAGIALALAGASPARGQGLQPPTGWRLDLDGPATAHAAEEGARERPDTYWFVEMRPGWHVTMGPGGRLFDPGFRGEDRYALEANVFLFPGTTGEGYGLFFGGSGEGAGAAWLAALFRRDGSAALLRHGPGVHEWLSPWTRYEAVRPQAGEEAMGNLFRVDVRRDSVHVFANGTQLYAVPRTGLVTDGAFGFRIGREVNVHASSLDHTRRLAGVPAAR